MGFWKNSTVIIFPHNYENHDFKIIITAFVITILKLCIALFIQNILSTFPTLKWLWTHQKVTKSNLTLYPVTKLLLVFYVTKKNEMYRECAAGTVWCAPAHLRYICEPPLCADLKHLNRFHPQHLDAYFQPLGSCCTRGFLP